MKAVTQSESVFVKLGAKREVEVVACSPRYEPVFFVVIPELNRDYETVKSRKIGYIFARPQEPDGYLFYDDNNMELDIAKLAPFTLAVGSFDGPGRIASEAIRAFLQNRFSRELDQIHVGGHTDIDPSLVFQSRLVDALAQRHERQSVRNVDLMRQAMQLRIAHERIQSSFASLERFVTDNALAHRTPSRLLYPKEVHGDVDLADGDIIRQRLPQSSAGLSDIAVWPTVGSTDADGVLTVVLVTLEDGAEIARWRILGCDMGNDWLRLSLPRSLASDPMTPEIRLAWEGGGVLRLRCAVRHPDARHQASLNERPTGVTLALRTWTYICGCEAPGTTDGIFPPGTVLGRRYLSQEVINSARSLNSHAPFFMAFENDAALQVHVVQDKIAIGAIPAAVKPGAIEIAARILTRSPDGPAIEYALGVALPDRRPAAIDEPPDFDPGYMSDWQRMDPLIEGEARLRLPAATTRTHDLYLMTRVAEPGASIDFGWSTFRNIWIEHDVL